MIDATSTPLPWSHAVVDIPDGGLATERSATASECAAIKNNLGLASLTNVTATYRITRLAGGGYHLAGRVKATLEQACVVTLDPIALHMDEVVDVEFWPDATPTRHGSGKRDKDFDRDDEHPSPSNEVSVLTGPDVEPLEDGAMAVGRVVFETVSAALDPFPRKADAEFNWQDQTAEDPTKSNPFAVLQKLKDTP